MPDDAQQITGIQIDPYAISDSRLAQNEIDREQGFMV
jgi:hypothetical protein